MALNMVIAQSGGPSSVINSSLAGAVKKAFGESKIGKVYGSIYGLEGILKNQIVDLKEQIGSDADIEALKITPAMALGSCRYKLTEDKKEDFKKILDFVKERNIGYFFYIGGNDSMDTVDKLSTYFKENKVDVKVIGIPKTIDNDLMNTDHTPGFASAARYVAMSVREVYSDTLSYDKETVTFVEIMGRNAGWLAASSVMARGEDCPAPQMVYLPEKPVDIEEFKRELKEFIKRDKVVLVAVSEGIKNIEGEYISATKSQSHDTFGHAQLKGAGGFLENIAKEMGYKTRTIELSLLQRSAAHISSPVDVMEAFRCGEKAVEFAMEGKTGIMVAMKRKKNQPYEIEYVPEVIGEISNKEKMIPLEWIDGNDLKKEFNDYMRPLLHEKPEEAFYKHFRLDKSKIV